MRKVDEAILCAGHGGQGIILMGKMIAYSGMQTGYQVTWIPSYGAEVRGGTAHSMVKIRSEGTIANPIVAEPTIAVIMNKPSLVRFAKSVKPGGLLIVDSSEIKEMPKLKGVTIVTMPFTAIAERLKEKRAANMVALGALLKIKHFFPMKELVQCLELAFPGKLELIELNIKALNEGYGIDI